LTHETRGRGFTWFAGLGDNFAFLLSDFRKRGLEFSFLTSNSQFNARDDEVRINVLEEWTDPRSRFRVPCKWHLSVFSRAIELDVDINGYLRGYYPWTFMKHSFSVLYFFLSNMKGYYLLKDNWKRKLFSREDRCYVHTNWSFHQRKDKKAI
jgi:hypothetical protein